MSRAFLLCLAVVPWLQAVAAELPPQPEPRSVCQIAGKLMSGCLPLKATGTRGEVSLDFAVEADAQHTLVAGIGETTAKTTVVVPVAQGAAKRLRRPEEQSEWCNPKKD